jgi:4-alpha-glucanotransferase
LTRSSGILLHPTSLPGRFGIGDLGEEARAFLAFLKASGQRLWQVLPLGPTGYGNSPYQSLSAFAGNPLLIDPLALVAEGLLTNDDLIAPAISAKQVQFEAARSLKEQLLTLAFRNYQRAPRAELRAEFEQFCELSHLWLDDYALFRALKNKHEGAGWWSWERELAARDPSALHKARTELSNEVTAQKFFQFCFFRQWNALRDHSNALGIKIIGDLPIFVAHDSADVWVNREYFKLDDRGDPTKVAGVPPDYFSDTGQLWGNPVYNWDALRRDGFKWWTDRVGFALTQFDLLRIDHFRGFAAGWEIPAGDPTAQNGEWVTAPGQELFAALSEELSELPIIAENLGVITPDVEALRDEFGFPGMRVLQFAFGDDATNLHLPHNYSRDLVAYTGTHDNDTTVGWFEQADSAARSFCLRYLNSEGRDIHWDFIRAVLASVADTVITPLQDVLGLGNESRMNLPASESGNWLWRFSSGSLTDDVSERLRQMTETYGRQ